MRGSGAGGCEAVKSPTPKSIRILLVDDHAILREGVRALLEAEADIEVVGEAGTPAEATRLAREAQPTLAIVDLMMACESGLKTIGELRGACAALRALVLSAHFSDEYLSAALAAGADGYVLKSAKAVDLLRAIRSVAAGHRFFSSEVSGKLVSAYLRRDERATDGHTRITPRERQLLVRIALGDSNKRLAAMMCRSVKTVEKHRANLMRKLRLRNTAELTLFAVRSGVVPLSGGAGQWTDGGPSVPAGA
ncbi:MAG TPA: response regulator transcription factor [Steroidobacteraceae bacterium]